MVVIEEDDDDDSNEYGEHNQPEQPATTKQQTGKKQPQHEQPKGICFCLFFRKVSFFGIRKLYNIKLLSLFCNFITYIFLDLFLSFFASFFLCSIEQYFMECLGLIETRTSLMSDESLRNKVLESLRKKIFNIVTPTRRRNKSVDFNAPIFDEVSL